MKKRLLAINIAFILILGGCTEPEKEVYSGTVEGIEIPILTELGGTIQRLDAHEGQILKKGDVLAILDQRILEQQVQEAKASVEMAQAVLDDALSGTRDQEIKKAMYAIDQNQGQLQQIQSNQTRIEVAIEQHQALLKQAQIQLESADSSFQFQQSKLNDMKSLYEAGAESKEHLESQQEAVQQARLTVDKLQAQVEAQASQLRMAEKERDSIKAQLKQASAQRKAAEAQLDLLREGATANKIKQLLAQKQMAEARYEQVKIQLSKAIITSPTDGMVVRQNVSVGEVLKPSYQLMTLLEKDQLELTVYVPEARLGEIELGKEVLVTVDAFPEESFKGKVKYISEEAEFTPKNVQTPDERTKMVFAVTIELAEGWNKLKPGMPADVVIAEGKQP